MMAVARLGGRENKRGTTVDDAAGVSSRDASVLLEGGRQLRQDLERRLGPQMVIASDDLDAFCRFDFNRHDLVRQTASIPGTGSKLLTAERVAVLLFSRDAVLCGAVFGRHRHRA